MPLINGNVNLVLSWSPTCVISSATGEIKFKITDTKLYVPVVTLSAQDNAELLQQLKSGLKRTIKWNISIKSKNICIKQIFKSLGWSEFSRSKQTFCIILDYRTSHPTYYLPKVEIKDYNVTIDGKNFFDKPINSKLKTYENIRRVAIGQGDEYMTGCFVRLFLL